MKKLLITLSVVGLSATQVNASVTHTYVPNTAPASDDTFTNSDSPSYNIISNETGRSVSIVTPNHLGMIEELEASKAELKQKEKELLTLSEKFIEINTDPVPSFATAANNNFSARSRLGKSSPPAIAAAKAKRAAHSRTVGLCARYVRKALQAAGYSFTPNPSAYQYATRGTLAKAGFTKISNNSAPQVGDIVVYNRSAKHRHGHIQIFDGNNWVSDFKQSRKNPYRTNYSFTTWRDTRYLNDASNAGVYLAMGE